MCIRPKTLHNFLLKQTFAAAATITMYLFEHKMGWNFHFTVLWENSGFEDVESFLVKSE
jgi:hypothetical protein